ncbi:MAG TPA: hypothetical protein VK901_03620 [Nitrospiraceae bacterium]|nr:hypothetical protein [Nitrospiraceae bacterium]
MKTIVISIPDETKARLDALRTQGYTLNGYVRAVLERELADKPKPRLPRKSR